MPYCLPGQNPGPAFFSAFPVTFQQKVPAGINPGGNFEFYLKFMRFLHSGQLNASKRKFTYFEARRLPQEGQRKKSVLHTAAAITQPNPTRASHQTGWLNEPTITSTIAITARPNTMYALLFEKYTLTFFDILLFQLNPLVAVRAINRRFHSHAYSSSHFFVSAVRAFYRLFPKDLL